MDEIITEYWAKPGPERQWDWSAHRKSYEPGWPIGYGRTEQHAIDDLLEQEVEDAARRSACPCQLGAPGRCGHCDSRLRANSQIKQQEER